MHPRIRIALAALPLLALAAGCGPSDKQETVDKTQNVQRYEQKASQMGQSRQGGQGTGASDPNVTGPPR